MKWMKKIGYIIATVLFLVLIVGPFVWTFVMSVSPIHEMFAPTTKLFPSDITFGNYQHLFSGSRKTGQYFQSLENSMKAVGLSLAIGLPVAMASAYALSKMGEFRGKKLIKNLLLVTMVIPVMATIIPLYKLFAQGHMLDNMFWLCMVYVSAYLPMSTWMIMNYFSTIPKELEEAAMIDGCGKVQSFFHIILPLSFPIIISVMLIIFLNTWSQFQIPLILASSMNTKPMAIVVSEFVTKDTVEYGLIAAAGIISLIPPAVTAMIFRKYLISGMMKGSVKG